MPGNRRIVGWFIGAASTVAVVVALSFSSFERIEQTAEARKQNNLVLHRANELLTSLVDAETAERGYLLTGNERFLEPYLRVRDEVEGHLRLMQGSSSVAQEHLTLVAPMITAKMAFLEENIELRRADDLAAALVNVRSARGKALMDSIRAELGSFTELVEVERDAAHAAFMASMRSLYFTLVLTGLLSLLVTLWLARLIHRQTEQRLTDEVHAVTRRALVTQEKASAELQRAHATLQVSEEKLAVTLNSIGDAVIATDEQARVTLFNTEAERLTGWPRTEALGRPIDEVFRIINEETRLPSTIPVLSTLAEGTTQGLANHTVLISRNSEEWSIADSCAPIRERSGQVVGAVLVFRDVSTEHAVQRALGELQFYTRSLIESNVDALVTTNPGGKITDANRPMALLTGYSREELIGTDFKAHFTDALRAENGISLTLVHRRVSDYELTVRARDGALTVVSYNATTFYDRDGKLQGVFAVARDVTDRKRFELELHDKNVELEKATAVAEKANLAKSEFLSSMSHELRSPLNAILGFAQLMDTDAAPPTPNQAEGIAQILKAGWHLLTLINEILDLARVESGQVPLSKEPVSLAEVFLECQGMIAPQAQQRGIRLVFPDFPKPRFVHADHTRLKQVMINLLSNAIKYNTANGSVTVSYAEPTTGAVRVSISDTGPGLSPAQVGQLFQAFNRLGQEAGGEEGTGIGLVVSRRLIELMGGTIGVESTVGAGSVFWFELPAIEGPHLEEGDEPSLATGAEALSRPAPVRSVLYVEDNPANLLLVKQIIARLPSLRLLTAADARTGIDIARASRPDVVLMDINLPGLNGVEAMKILRADPVTAGIPVMALSANALPRDVEKGLQAGFFRYITKPIQVNEFIRALQSALELPP